MTGVIIMLKACILGYGGIARSHRKGYELLKQKGAPVELVALCDIDESQFTKEVSINNATDSASKLPYRTYTDLDKMLDEEKPDIVDICLPTYMHCEYVEKLLKLGYNVQSEKPMGLNSKQCESMISVAKESAGKLMIGMCLRFDNMYIELKKMIDSGIYGKVTAAYFTRQSSLPRWGYDGWFRDYKRSGGVALDMHIHDVDMIRFLFGEPEAVSSITSDIQLKCASISSNFVYPDKLVHAIGDWGMSTKSKFQAGYRVNFEKATVFLNQGVITVSPNEGEIFDLEFEKNNHMATEIEYFANTVLGNFENTKTTPEDAAKTVALVEKLMESAENGGKRVEVK